MPTIFSKIISGEVPCHKVLENEKFLAFLDIRPVKKGHALVIPKKEVDYLFDLEDAELAELMAFAKKVAKKIKKVVPCLKVGVMVAGLEVPHAHVHLIPIEKVFDLNFANAKQIPADELTKLADQIRSA